MTKRQSWIYQQMGFLKTHIKRKGANRCSGFEASRNTSRHEESRGSTTDKEHLETSVLRENRSPPILTSTPVSTDSKILEHFDQMRTLISGFLQQKSDRRRVKYYPRDQPLLPKSHRGSGYCQQPLNRHLVPPRQQQAAVPAVTSTTHPAPLAFETLHQWSQYRTRAVH